MELSRRWFVNCWVFIFKVVTGAVTWCAKKQSAMALSTTLLFSVKSQRSLEMYSSLRSKLHCHSAKSHSQGRIKARLRPSLTEHLELGTTQCFLYPTCKEIGRCCFTAQDVSDILQKQLKWQECHIKKEVDPRQWRHEPHDRKPRTCGWNNMPRLNTLCVSWQQREFCGHSNRLIQVSQHLIRSPSSP